MSWPVYIAGAAALAGALPKVKTRLELSKAKHPSLRGHSRMGRFVAALVPFYEYDETQIFRSDDAPDEIAEQRRAGFMRLSALYRERFAKSVRADRPRPRSRSPTCSSPPPTACRSSTAASCGRHLRAGSFLASSSGVHRHRSRRQQLLRSDRLVRRQRLRLRLLQGLHRSRRRARARRSAPCWAPTTRSSRRTSQRLREISGLDEVSFHMSGTEAVMQAVRLARYHTRRSHLVRFCGAYHGWWGDVQPGVGNPSPAHETYTLKEMDEDTLRVLRTRQGHRLRAGQPAAGAAPERQRAQRLDAASTAAAAARYDRAALHRVARGAARGLHRARHRADLRRGVRRLPPRARRRAGVLRRQGRPRHLRQDAGRRAADRRAVRPQGAHAALPRRPAGRHLLRARHVQLAPLRHGGDATSSCERIETPEIARALRDLDRIWNDARRSASTNGCATKGCPVRVANLSSIWTVTLHAAVALQLDAAILPARRGAGVELGGHRPLHLQPQLHRRRLRRRRRQASWPRRAPCSRTASGGRTRR